MTILYLIAAALVIGSGLIFITCIIGGSDREDDTDPYDGDSM